MIELNDDNFDGIVNSEELILVDFWAPWCGPCKTSLPYFDAFAEQNPNIETAKVNIDDAENLMIRLGIKSVPTFILFRNGVEVVRHVGSVTSDLLGSKFSNKS